MPNTLEILNAISILAGSIALLLFFVFRKSMQKYVDEKAKNLATIEDTSKITNEIEKVKVEYLQRSHAWKQIFEFEYKVLREVWSATWDFQAHARSLRPMLDHLPDDSDKQKEVFVERYKKYAETANMFRDVVIKNQPFMPVCVYEACMSLREIVIELQVDFEMSFQEQQRPDWKLINECSKKLDERIEKLNVSIRDYIYGKIRT